MKYTNSIPGWISETDLQFLYDKAQEMESIVEIGSWLGRSTHALLSGCSGLVNAVDNWQGITDSTQNCTKEYADEHDVYNQFLRNLLNVGHLNVYKMSSKEASVFFEDKSIDMVFIDGDHIYEAVKQDIKLWLPKTKKLICGHDYLTKWQGVVKAVNSLIGDVKTVDAIWYKEIK